MNLNLLSYAIFFPAMVGIAVYVAQVCHRNGRLWMLRIFDGEEHFVDAVNNVLLVGCYVLNAGYVALVVSRWEPITTLTDMLGTLSQRIALILFTLAGLHYQNIAVLMLWARVKHRNDTGPATGQPSILATTGAAAGQRTEGDPGPSLSFGRG